MTDPSPGQPARPVRPCQHVRAQHEHGTRAAYVLDRCRCAACSAANTAQARQRTTAIAYGRWRGLIDAAAVRQHVQELRDAGLSLLRISAGAGVGLGTLNSLIYGEPSRGKPPSVRVRSDTASRLLAVTPTTGQSKSHADLPGRGASGHRLGDTPRHPRHVAHEACVAPNAITRTLLPTCNDVSTLSRPNADRHALRQEHNGIQLSSESGIMPTTGITRTQPDRNGRGRGHLPAGDRLASAQAASRYIGIDRSASTDPDDLDENADLPVEGDLDTVAIERAMTGEPVPLTRRERQEAIDRLTRQGRSAAHIADLLHVNPRTITRARSAQRASAA